MEKKVLTLTVSKQWFDMIADGRKNEEYREIKPYWVARLFHNNSNIIDVRNLASALAGRTDLLKKYIDAQRIVLKQYTHVLFINGYRKDSPRIEKEIESITIGKPKKGLCPDKWLDTEFLSLNSSDMNYIQCDECKYRLVCNGEPLTSGSTGSCDHHVISNTPIFPKIKTPPDERYADIWNW